MIKVLIGVVIATVIVIVAFLLIDPKQSTVHEDEISEVSSVSGGYKYSIEGEVYKAGTYTLNKSVSMAELIAAAGGLTNNADPLCFFEDAILKSGETYYIASKYDSSDICNSSAITKVNINEDSAETLTTINGITSSIASSIVSYRTENGTFNTLEDLLSVYGIGNATYRKIRNYVTLHS